MSINYTSAINLLNGGNTTQAVVATYTTPLGVYAWFLVTIATLIMVYIKTQSAGLTAMVGLVFLSAARFYLGIIGDGVFLTVMAFCIMIVIFRFWK